MGDEDPLDPGPRFDERDTMFARMARRARTPPYEEYYSRRPELQKADDRVYGRRWNPRATAGVKGV